MYTQPYVYNVIKHCIISCTSKQPKQAFEVGDFCVTYSYSHLQPFCVVYQGVAHRKLSISKFQALYVFIYGLSDKSTLNPLCRTHQCFIDRMQIKYSRDSM
jgi:hypothetical protein